MSTCKANILLFAAGLGTRLRPATDSHPKPALPLFSIPMGYYSLPYFSKIDIQNFIVNTFHLPDQVQTLYKKLNLNIEFSDEIGFIKGSGGGLLQALPLLKKNQTENFDTITANADEIFFTKNTQFLNQALEQHQNLKSLATLVVMKHPEAGHKFGAIWVKNNKVIAIGKIKPDIDCEPWHFIGLQILNSEIFKFIEPNKEQNIFYDVLNNHLQTQNVQIFPIETDWYETGNLPDYKLAKDMISKKLSTSSDLMAIYKAHFEDLKKWPQSDLSDLA